VQDKICIRTFDEAVVCENVHKERRRNVEEDVLEVEQHRKPEGPAQHIALAQVRGKQRDQSQYDHQ
jgi:hypothetical protein